MTLQPTTKAVRGAAWTVALFYLLIVFEFFYMATPFALYLYGVYLPGLESLDRVPALAWLTLFFLPHYVPTSSALVNSAPVVGGVLTTVGMLAFLAGAAQVYSQKLLQRGAVMGGVYRFLRHPQYAALIVAGAGMLLMWPRFLMVVFLVSMLFVYRVLASIEERECLARYGQGYADYQQMTPGFLPLRIPGWTSLAGVLSARPWWIRSAAAVAGYAAVLSVSIGAAFVLQAYSLRNTFAYESDTAVYVSLTPLDTLTLARLVKAAEADSRVDAHLAGPAIRGARFINYVMPQEWSIPEIPMRDVHEHHTPGGYDSKICKIIYTRAVFSGESRARGLEIVRHAVRNEPVAEAWIDQDDRVSRVMGPPGKTFYGAVPVPLF